MITINVNTKATEFEQFSIDTAIVIDDNASVTVCMEAMLRALEVAGYHRDSFYSVCKELGEEADNE